MASGPVNRIKRQNTWLHRPMLQNVKKALANPADFAMSVVRGGSEVRDAWPSVAFDPLRTSDKTGSVLPAGVLKSRLARRARS